MTAFRERLGGWLEKAMREAKRHSEWAAPNEEYESAAQDFLARCLDPQRASGVVSEIAAFARRIAPAGAANSLAQTILRLTSPGVPDLYQGCEFWDFSMVDPDNRRPVDWAAREAALEAGGDPAALLAHWHDGRVKQAVIARALAMRRRAPALFAHGAYLPLTLQGPAAEHAIAFARTHEGRATIVVTGRLMSLLLGENDSPLADPSRWADTAVMLPRNLQSRRWTDLLGGSAVAAPRFEHAQKLLLSEIFATFPVALLEA